jgi:hypothetical protein
VPARGRLKEARKQIGHFTHALTPALQAFRDGIVPSGKPIGTSLANEHFSRWQTGPDSRAVVQRVVREWFRDVKLQLEEEPPRICEKYGLAENVLRLPRRLT